MAVDVKRFEMDRLLNIIKSLGWELVTSAFEGDIVKVTVQKLVTTEAPTPK